MAKTKKIGFLFTAVDKTKTTFNVISKSLNKIGSAAKTVGKGLLAVTAAVAAAGAAFGALVLKTTDYIDNLGKVSEVTGVSTDLLQKFRFAAEQAGVTGDNAALAIRRFSRRLGEAAKGSGELKPALDRLGISVFNIDGTTKSAEKVLLEFADGIAKTKNQSERLALAFKGFDSEGAELFAILNKGSAGLKEFFETAQRLGIVLDKEAIKNTMLFRDRLNELTTSITSFSRRVISELTPAFTKMIEKITVGIEDFAEASGGFDKLGHDFAKGMIDGFILVAEGLQHLTLIFSRFMALTGFESEAVKQLREEYSKLADDVRRLSDVGKLDQGTVDRMNQINEEIGKLKTGGAETFNALISSLKEFKSAIGETKPLIEDVVETGIKLNQDQVKKSISFLGSIKAAVKTVTEQLTGAFTEFFNITSEKFMDFKSLVTSILKSIISAMTKAFVQNKFMSWLGGTSFGSFLGLEGKAVGGTVTAGRPYLVGEKGAELFVPNQTGTIVPNDKMSGGATNVNVAFNITAWDSKDATQAIAQQAPNIVSIVENSFRRRGQILGAT